MEESKNGFVKKYMLLLFALCFATIFGMLLCYNLMTGVKKYPLSVGIAAVCALLLLLLKKRGPQIPEGACRFLTPVLLTVSAVRSFVLGFSLRTEYSSYTWDWVRIVTDCARCVTEEGTFPASYYAEYPNNRFICVLLTGFFRLVQKISPGISYDGLITASVFLSSLSVVLSVWILYAAVRVFAGEKEAFLFSVVSCLYTPLYLYATFAYTDTLSLPFISLGLLFFALFQKSAGEQQSGREAVCIALCGMCFGLGGEVKTMAFIYLIAVVITLLISEDRLPVKNLLILAAGAFLVIFLSGKMAGRMFPYSQEEYDRYRFPAEQWIFMSLNPDGSGGYNGDDVHLAENTENYEARKALCREMLKGRVSQLGLKGTLEKMFYTKQLRTWTNPALSGDDYIMREPMGKGFLRKLYGKKKKLHKKFMIGMEALHLLLLFGTMLSVFPSGNQRKETLLLRISLVGIFLFLSIWECNSRYLYIFIPALLITSSETLLFPRDAS
ncbi:MAG: glycosyltransferase family 39 protein [Lachnospiraceae bacterium]|nr:glycosyltransferase family 39 protein [Lachnospiraceae bacterium]